MTRERLAWLVGLLVLAVAGWWVSANTEWVDNEIYGGPQGAAEGNPVYPLEQLLRHLGMKVEHREAFDPLPPAGGRLLLLSDDWQLIPGRAEALRLWVHAGGHLILPNGPAGADMAALSAWMPVQTVAVREPPAQAASAPVPASSRAALALRINRRAGVELASAPPLWGTTQRLNICLLSDLGERLRTKPGQLADWSLMRELGAEALRVPLGRGSVTVVDINPTSFFGQRMLDCDNAQLVAALVRAEPGASLLVYLNEKREALLPWLWHQGWIAVVVALLALAAMLWRASLRFGPPMAAAPRLRRSIVEQVRGLGQYLQREGREALLAAQQRALDETAARLLPGYRTLAPAQRAGAIAAATEVAAEALSTALNTRDCPRAEMPARLQLLESARRLLLSRTSSLSSSS